MNVYVKIAIPWVFIGLLLCWFFGPFSSADTIAIGIGIWFYGTIFCLSAAFLTAVKNVYSKIAVAWFFILGFLCVLFAIWHGPYTSLSASSIL
ncbi:hypothetical protein J7L49_06540, partial [Candidatus Bathyarchaeota archaeon]|nr:hypothetical protein [Candidatus Bathyarchaeota archaeon]